MHELISILLCSPVVMGGVILFVYATGLLLVYAMGLGIYSVFFEGKHDADTT